MKMKKAIAMVLAVMLIVALSVAGTIAWLMDETDEVVNTFTVGKVAIDLRETCDNAFLLIPGNKYEKDPVVYVTAGSEKCYLFVEINKNNNPDNYLEYTINTDGWTTDDTTIPSNVMYRIVEKSTSEQSWPLMVADNDGNTVVVKTNIVNTDAVLQNGEVAMPSASEQPTLSFKAYAVQFDNMTSVAAAWALVSATP